MPRVTLLTALLALSVAATADAGNATVPEVITDIPVVHSLTSMVMGDLGTPKLLLKEGADAHEFQLRPSQVSTLQGADLLIWIGPEMSPWLDRALHAASPPNTLALLHTKGTIIRGFDWDEGQPPDQAHVESDASPLPEHRHGTTHDHGGIDPHAWLDPENASLWLGLISDALVQRDPGNSVTYRANASLAQIRIDTASRVVRDKLAGHEGEAVVTAHDAYGYFADHFGVSVAANLAEGDASDPGAAHLSAIRALLESGEIRCIFPEAGRDPSPVLSLSEGTEVRIGRNLDPEGRLMAPGPNLYPALLTNIGAVLADCLEGR